MSGAGGTNRITRKSLADEFGRLDAVIEAANDQKRDAMKAYREQLAEQGHQKDAVKEEAEAFRKAFARRRAVAKHGKDAVEHKDALADEIYAEISAHAPRATRAREEAAQIPGEDQLIAHSQIPVTLPSQEGVTGSATADVPPAEVVAHNHRRMTMTPLEPREAGGLKGFGFTVKFEDDQSTAALKEVQSVEPGLSDLADPVGTRRPDTADSQQSAVKTPSGNQAPPVEPFKTDAQRAMDAVLEKPAKPDRTKPNPLCLDPAECGVEASWNYLCLKCQAAAKQVA